MLVLHTADMAIRKKSPARPRGRPRTQHVPYRPFSSRVREDYLERLLRLAATTGKPQTRLLEEALTQYFERLEDED